MASYIVPIQNAHKKLESTPTMDRSVTLVVLWWLQLTNFSEAVLFNQKHSMNLILGQAHQKIEN